jgi:squalene-hopene/tetraprenyl-beta-curcumene cyclase
MAHGHGVWGTVCLIAWVALSAQLPAQEKASTQASLKEVVRKGIQYLEKTGQGDDGMFSPKAGPGVSALVLTAMMRHNVDMKNATLVKGLKALEGYVKPDGGVYGNGRLKNYETCVAVLAFAEANKRLGDGRYNTLLANAKTFLTTLQYADSASDPEYGGVGYAGKGRPDLSNTAYLIEALHSVDADKNDPAIQRALVFISRCQNLKSEHNDNPLAAKVNDGGFFYTLPSEKEVESHDRGNAVGGLRSYGSMTYSGFKSMIYAGLKSDDVRVKAARDWIAKNYTLDDNPGMGQAGLYYYFHTFGAALKASSLDKLTGPDGKDHDWRNDLVLKLAKDQDADGSWKNANRQWMEDDKNLATAFALLALAYCY